MELSSTFCRAQQSLQHERAASAILDNVRTIAGKAASAWGLEALAAERREARRDRTRLAGQAEGTGEGPSMQAEDRLVSENPDRGQAES